jgi:hypothetical protein
MADEALKKTGVSLTAEGADAFKTAIQSSNDALSKFGQIASDSAKGIDAFGQIAIGAFRQVGAFATTFVVESLKLVADSFNDLFKSATEFEQLQAKLSNTIESTGGAAGVTSAEAQKLADQFKDLAGGSDETVLSIEQMAIRMGTISSQQMPDFIKASLNLAAATGVDAANGARLLAMAYDDPEAAMGRLRMAHIVFTADVKEQIKDMEKAGNTAGAFAVFMEELNKQTGGAAAAQADTLAGKWSILSNHLEDAGRAVMMHLLPPLEKLLDVVTPILTNLADAFSGQLGTIIDNAAVWGEAILENLASGMRSAAQEVVSVIQELGQIIASWLEPGSPPKFLPELQDWGREAAEVWAQGFASADLSAFNSLNSSITAFVKSGGSMDSSLVTNYIGALYGARDANAALVAAQSSERDMNAALTAAQENLNRVTSQYDAILNPLKNQLSAAQNKKTEADDAVKIMDLQRIANDTSINQMERNKAAAEIDVIKTQEKVNKVQLEKDIAVQSAQVKVEAARIEEAAAKMSLEAARQSAEVAKSNLEMQKEALDLATKQQELAQEALKKETGTGLGGGGLGIGKPNKIDTGAHADTSELDKVKQKIQEIMNFFKPDVLQANLFLFANSIRTWIEMQVPKIAQELGLLIGSAAGWLLTTGLPQLITAFGKVIQGVFTFVYDMTPATNEGKIFADSFSNGFTVGFAPFKFRFWEMLNDAAIGATDLLLIMNAKVRQIIAEGAQQWIILWGMEWAIIGELFKRAFDFIVGLIKTWAVNVMLNFNKLVADIQSAFVIQKWIDLGKSVMDGLGKGIKDNMDAVAGRAIDAAKGIIENIKKALKISSPSAVFAEIGQNMMEGMALGIQMNANVPSLAAAGAVSNVVQTTNYGGNSYNYAPTYGSAPNSPSTDFAIMQVMAG